MNRRRISKLAIFILLGAIVNVAVAWGCAFLCKVPLAPQGSYEVGLTGPFSQKHGAPREFTRWGRFATPGLELQGLRGMSQKYDDRGVLAYWIGNCWVDAIDVPGFLSEKYDVRWYSAGLPLLSLEGGEWTIEDYPIHDPTPVRRLQMGFWFGATEPQAHVGIVSLRHRAFIPLRPAWPGFAINTIFYAAILWLLLAFPFTARRWRRIKRGQCPACGYPVGSGDTCTECGTVLKTGRTNEESDT